MDHPVEAMKQFLALALLVLVLGGALWKLGCDPGPLTIPSDSEGNSVVDPHGYSESGGTRTPVEAVAEEKGFLSLTSWPDYSPLQGEELILRDELGSVGVFTTNIRGEIKLNPGKWSIVPGGSEFQIFNEGFGIIHGKSTNLIGYHQTEIEVIVRNSKNLIVPGVTVEWDPAFTGERGIGKKQAKTGVDGMASISAFNGPCTISLQHGDGGTRAWEFPVGIPSTGRVILFLPGDTGRKFSVSLVDSETGDSIFDGKASSNGEISLGQEDLPILIPERWCRAYSTIRFESTGYQPVVLRLRNGIPKEVPLAWLANAKVAFVNTEGVPLEGVVCRPIKAQKPSQMGVGTREVITSKIYSDKFGFSELECKEGDAIQLLCWHPSGLQGSLFIPEIQDDFLYTVTLEECLGLTLSMLDENGVAVKIGSDDVEIREIGGKRRRPKQSADGTVTIGNPSFVESIRIRPKGYLGVTLIRKAIRDENMPYETDLPWGKVQIQTERQSTFRGRITDFAGLPQSHSRFHLISIDESGFGGDPPRQLIGNKTWIARWDGSPVEVICDTQGEFEVGGIRPGEYALHRRGLSQGWVFGSGGESDPIVSIGQNDWNDLQVAGMIGAEVIAIDSATGAPIEKFRLIATNFASSNMFIRTADGEGGIWRDWIRTNLLENIEIQADGYESRAVFFSKLSGGWVFAEAEMVPVAAGRIIFSGPAAGEIKRTVINLKAVAGNGDLAAAFASWKGSAWVDEYLEASLSPPSGVGQVKVSATRIGRVGVKFVPSQFQYNPGEAISIQVHFAQ